MPIRLCADPGCSNKAHYRGRCDIHARTNDREIRRAGRHIYNTTKWHRTRKKYLAENPLCACGCGGIATDVHHKVDIDDGGAPWSWDNLEALTHEHHSRITRRRQGEATS